jgi:hypothetical protein
MRAKMIKIIPWLAIVIFLAIPLGMLIYGIISPMSLQNWVGTNGYTDTKGNVISPPKTLWDLMELLIIPVVLSVGAYLFSRAERARELRINAEQSKRDREAALDQTREIALQTYFDRMTELIIEKKLRESKSDDEVRAIARIRTLTVLEQLDGMRRGILLKFLYESGLIFRKHKDDNGIEKEPVIKMRGANLGDVIMMGGKFENIDLAGARLRKSYWIDTDFENAMLIDTDFTEANFVNAWMVCVELNKANLVGALFTLTKLRNANLCGAVMAGTNPKAKSFADAEKLPKVSATLKLSDLQGAKYDAETIFPDGFIPDHAGMIPMK